MTTTAAPIWQQHQPMHCSIQPPIAAVFAPTDRLQLLPDGDVPRLLHLVTVCTVVARLLGSTACRRPFREPPLAPKTLRCHVVLRCRAVLIRVSHAPQQQATCYARRQQATDRACCGDRAQVTCSGTCSSTSCNRGAPHTMVTSGVNCQNDECGPGRPGVRVLGQLACRLGFHFLFGELTSQPPRLCRLICRRCGTGADGARRLRGVQLGPTVE